MIAPVPTVEHAIKLAKRLVETVNQTCDVGGVALVPSITLGGVLSPDSAGDPRRLILLADEALYAAKAAGRNCWRLSASSGEAETLPIWRTAEGQGVLETVYLD